MEVYSATATIGSILVALRAGMADAARATSVVSNCGNVTLTNVVITDNLYGQVATFASLAPGGFQSYSKLVTNTCGNFTNIVTATGTASGSFSPVTTSNFPTGVGAQVVVTPTGAFATVRTCCDMNCDGSKDGMDIPAERATARPAAQQLGNGETYDFEFIPTTPGNLRFTVSAAVNKTQQSISAATPTMIGT